MEKMQQRSGYTWSRPNLLLWMKVDIKDKKRFCFALPLALPVLSMLVDMLDDYAVLYGVFAGLGKDHGKMPPAAKIRAAFAALKAVVENLIYETGPLDLVDVDTEEADGNHVRVKIALR